MKKYVHLYDINGLAVFDRTPLYCACQNGHANVVAALLAQGVDRNKRAVDGLSPFFVACASGHTDVAKLLLECENLQDRILTLCSPCNGIEPWFAAAQEGHLDMLKYFLPLDRSDRYAYSSRLSFLQKAAHAGQLM